MKEGERERNEQTETTPKVPTATTSQKVGRRWAIRWPSFRLIYSLLFAILVVTCYQPFFPYHSSMSVEKCSKDREGMRHEDMDGVVWYIWWLCRPWNASLTSWLTYWRDSNKYLSSTLNLNISCDPSSVQVINFMSMTVFFLLCVSVQPEPTILLLDFSLFSNLQFDSFPHNSFSCIFCMCCVLRSHFNLRIIRRWFLWSLL